MPHDKAQNILDYLLVADLIDMGRGYGQATRHHFTQLDISEVLDRLGNPNLVITTFEWGDDPYGVDEHTYSERLSIRKMLEEMADDSKYKPGQFRCIGTINDFKSYYSDYYDGFDGCQLVSVETEDEARVSRNNKEFARLESVARRFADQCEKGISTFEFIEALEKEIDESRYSRDSFNSHESRMEMYGACMYAGVGASGYFDDLNYENGRASQRIRDLEGVFLWLQRECPLLMARYQEEKLTS